MRKAQYTKPDRPLLVTVPEFQGYVGLGRKTAQRIAEEAGAIVKVGRLTKVNLKKRRHILTKLMNCNRKIKNRNKE